VLEFDCCFYTGNGVFLRPFQWPTPVPAAVEAERATQAQFLRCIFGNPFRTPPTVDPVWFAWNDGTVERVAEDAYQQRVMPAGTLDSQRLAILADALEEAGCSDADMLCHLRGPGPHVRGCCVVDAVVGKA
jgi:hypothetical protein